MNAAENVDAVVIGMGPGGEEVALKLADAGLTVVGIEPALVGGECANWGCVPTKMMIRAAQLLAESRRIPGMAGSAQIQSDWSPVAARIRDDATNDWNDYVAVERFEGKGGRFIRGFGILVAPDIVKVGEQQFRASKAIVIATGSSPAIPPIPGLQESPYWTNHHVVEASVLPRSLIILGGGAVGSELAQMLARFGVAITIVEAAPRLLPMEEPEAGDLLESVLRHEGITVIAGIPATRIEYSDNQFHVHLADGRQVRGERLLVATGRRVDLEAFGAEVLGSDPTAHALPVDDRLRVAERVWAVGDVTGKGAFTHIASYQAGIVVANILGIQHHSADYRAIPRVTFTDPEVGSVGFSKQAAIDAGFDVAIGHTLVPSTTRGWIHKSGNDGFIKLVVDRKSGTLLGATSMGPSGGEVLGLLTLAVHASIPIEQLRSMIYAYPTFHRGIEDALRDIY